MIIENIVFKSNEELIKKLNNTFFKGSFYLENGVIYWKYNDLLVLEIILFNQPGESCILWNKEHIHIPVEELFGYLIGINNMEFIVKFKKPLLGKDKKYLELSPSKGVINSVLDFEPFKHIGELNFGDSKKRIKSILGKIKREYKYTEDCSGIKFNNYDNMMVYYLVNEKKFYGIHFFNSLIFKMNDKFYYIDFKKFKIDDLKLISDDFVVTNEEEGKDYTSKKLGVDFYFNDDDNLEAVLFMSKEYLHTEIEIYHQ